VAHRDLHRVRSEWRCHKNASCTRALWHRKSRASKSLTYHKAIARVLGGSERRQGKKHESKHGEASHDERERGARERESTRTQTRGGRRTTSSSSGAAAELHTERGGQRPQGRWTAACSVPGHDRVSRSLSLSISVARHRLPLGFWATGCVSVSGRSRSEVVRRANGRARGRRDPSERIVTAVISHRRQGSFAPIATER